MIGSHPRAICHHQAVAARIASGKLRRRPISIAHAPRHCKREQATEMGRRRPPPGCPAHPTRKWKRGTGQQVRFADLTALRQTLCVLGPTGLMRTAAGSSNAAAPVNARTAGASQARWMGVPGEDFACRARGTRQRRRRRWKASVHAPRCDRGCPMEEAILSLGAGMSADAPKRGQSRTDDPRSRWWLTGRRSRWRLVRR